MAHFYLVSSGNPEDFYQWKWGITTKASAKARSSSYFDVHRWVEIPSMAIGRRLERLTAALVGLARGAAALWDEETDLDFPLELLCEIHDWAVENVLPDGSYTEAAQWVEAYAIPLCTCSTGPVEFADWYGHDANGAGFAIGQHVRDAYRAALVVKVEISAKELQPMWA
jgi:hypothetical protein